MGYLIQAGNNAGILPFEKTGKISNQKGNDRDKDRRDDGKRRDRSADGDKKPTRKDRKPEENGRGKDRCKSE